MVLYSSPNFMWMIKSRRMSWAGHVALTGKRRGTYRVSVRKPEERDHLTDTGINWWKMSRWIFRKWEGSVYRIDLAQDMDRWRTAVKAVMNLWVLLTAGKFLTS